MKQKISTMSQDELVGENGFAVTTWQYCWKCGRKLPLNSSKLLIKGVCGHCANSLYDEYPNMKVNRIRFVSSPWTKWLNERKGKK